MVTQPTNQDMAIQSLAQAIDILSGRVAALTAYVVHSANSPIADSDIRATQGLAQSISPSQLAAPGGTHPMLSASQGVEKIHSMAKSVLTTRSAGQHT